MPDIFLIDGGRPQINFLKKIFSERHLVKPLVGLSKLGGDILVFSSGTSAAVKDLALSVKPLLLLARDEAHRFGNSTRRRKLRNR
jgi:excinuclease UvrABC nuclease subunit